MLLTAIATLLLGLALAAWLLMVVRWWLDRRALNWRRFLPAMNSWVALAPVAILAVAVPLGARYLYIQATDDAKAGFTQPFWDWWILSAGACAVLALAALLAAVSFDPPRGRRRCGKCWYDYSGITDTAPCPECGRIPKTSTDLHRTRGQRGMAWLAALFIAAALGLWRAPTIADRGWIGEVPTTALILGIGVVPDEWISSQSSPLPGYAMSQPPVIRETLASRLHGITLWRWQLWLMDWRCQPLLHSLDDSNRCAAQACVGSKAKELAQLWREEDATELLRLAAQGLGKSAGADYAFGWVFAEALVGRFAGIIELSADDRAEWRALLPPMSPELTPAVGILMGQRLVPYDDVLEVLNAESLFQADRRANGDRRIGALDPTPTLTVVSALAKSSPETRTALQETVKNGDERSAVAAMRALAYMPTAKSGNDDWFADWSQSDRPFVVQTALRLAIHTKHELSVESLERTEQLARKDGAGRLLAIQLLATRAGVKPHDQWMCLELLKGEDRATREDVARSLVLCALSLDAAVVAELKRWRDAAGLGGPTSTDPDPPIELFLRQIAGSLWPRVYPTDRTSPQ